MSKVDAVDEVIRKHLGTSDFGITRDTRDLLGKFWARLIVDADTNAELTFNATTDAIALEDLRRNVRQCITGIDNLSPATKGFLSPTFVKWRIAQLLTGKTTNPFEDAREALALLLEWMDGLASVELFRTQARKGKNWRAASVAAMCRLVWGELLWEQAGKPPFGETARRIGIALTSQEMSDRERELSAEFNRFLDENVPRAEKHDAPGPFGRFLEDVFAALEIVGQDGNPFPAASALRSLAQQSKQLPRK